MPVSDAERGIVIGMSGRSEETRAQDDKLFSGFDYQVLRWARFWYRQHSADYCFLLQTQGDGDADSDSGDEALEHDVNPEEVPAVVKEAIRTESQLHLDADQTPADQK